MDLHQEQNPRVRRWRLLPRWFGFQTCSRVPFFFAPPFFVWNHSYILYTLSSRISKVNLLGLKEKSAPKSRTLRLPPLPWTAGDIPSCTYIPQETAITLERKNSPPQRCASWLNDQSPRTSLAKSQGAESSRRTPSSAEFVVLSLSLFGIREQDELLFLLSSLSLQDVSYFSFLPFSLGCSSLRGWVELCARIHRRKAGWSPWWTMKDLHGSNVIPGMCFPSVSLCRGSTARRVVIVSLARVRLEPPPHLAFGLAASSRPDRFYTFVSPTLERRASALTARRSCTRPTLRGTPRPRGSIFFSLPPWTVRVCTRLPGIHRDT